MSKLSPVIDVVLRMNRAKKNAAKAQAGIDEVAKRLPADLTFPRDRNHPVWEEHLKHQHRLVGQQSIYENLKKLDDRALVDDYGLSHESLGNAYWYGDGDMNGQEICPDCAHKLVFAGHMDIDSLIPIHATSGYYDICGYFPEEGETEYHILVECNECGTTLLDDVIPL